MKDSISTSANPNNQVTLENSELLGQWKNTVCNTDEIETSQLRQFI